MLRCNSDSAHTLAAAPYRIGSSCRRNFPVRPGIRAGAGVIPGLGSPIPSTHGQTAWDRIASSPFDPTLWRVANQHQAGMAEPTRRFADSQRATEEFRGIAPREGATNQHTAAVRRHRDRARQHSCAARELLVVQRERTPPSRKHAVRFRALTVSLRKQHCLSRDLVVLCRRPRCFSRSLDASERRLQLLLRRRPLCRRRDQSIFRRRKFFYGASNFLNGHVNLLDASSDLLNGRFTFSSVPRRSAPPDRHSEAV